MMLMFLTGRLAMDLGVSVGEFGSWDGDSLRVRGEVQRRFHLCAVELVVFGRLHVHHRVPIDVLLEDHRLQNNKQKNHTFLFQNKQCFYLYDI